jgi:chitin synthase
MRSTVVLTLIGFHFIHTFELIYLNCRQQPVQAKKNWDVFTNYPRVIISGSMADRTCMEVSLQIVKVLAYIGTFIFVLGGAVLSKGTLLFMTSQLRTNITVDFCNRSNGNHELSLPLPYFLWTT